MALQLERPLCVFDLETTGLQITKDRIVQIAVIKLFEDGHTETFNELVNPGQTISSEIAAIHGITNEMVADAPTFEALAPRLLEFIGNADLAGYNSNKFDILVLHFLCTKKTFHAHIYLTHLLKVISHSKIIPLSCLLSRKQV